MGAALHVSFGRAYVGSYGTGIGGWVLSIEVVIAIIEVVICSRQLLKLLTMIIFRLAPTAVTHLAEKGSWSAEFYGCFCGLRPQKVVLRGRNGF